MCSMFPKLEAKTSKHMGDMKQIFQTFHSRTKNFIVIMTLTLTMEVICRSNLFVVEGHGSGVSKDQAHRQYDNKLWNKKTYI